MTPIGQSVISRNLSQDEHLPTSKVTSYFQSAVERQFEVLSESLNLAERDEPEIRSLIPELPVVVGLRNRISHEYDEIDHQIIWDTVHVDLPGLAIRISTLLEEFGLPEEA